MAESSFNAIVGMKAQGSAALDGNTPRTREFMAAIMRDLGVGAELGNAEDQAKHIYGIIGDNPSYFAQLEILAKRIYQSPSFFAGLYDKPVNVARKSAALSAIENMIDREIYESQLRQEMNMSVLLSTQLEAEFEKASSQIGSRGRLSMVLRRFLILLVSTLLLCTPTAASAGSCSHCEARDASHSTSQWGITTTAIISAITAAFQAHQQYLQMGFWGQNVLPAPDGHVR